MPEIDPAIPIKDLLASRPEFRPILAAYDIDTCCGGEHPLEVACQARGLDVADVLRELGHAVPSVGPGDPPRVKLPSSVKLNGSELITPVLSIREILRRFPSTAAVFERHGLGDCGGDNGPDEPLGWFATVHRVALDPLLSELRAAAASEASRLPEASVPKAPARPFSPEFIVGSLALTLTLGATTGMINLLRIAAGGEVPFSHRQMHGHTQILGFAALFLMGIAFHALPRITGVGGGPPKTARPAFWLMAGGVLLRNFGQPFNLAPVGRAASLLSGVAELSAGCLFAAFILDLLRRAPTGKYGRSDPFLQLIGFGTAALLVALLVNAAQSVWLAGHLETALPASLSEPFYFVSLYGFLLAWVFGFSNRVVALFLGLPAPPAAPARTALALQAFGVGAILAAAIPGLPAASAALLRDAAMCAVALAAIVFVVGSRLLARPTLPALVPKGNPLFAIRAAFVCLLLWAALELGAVVVARATAFPAQNPWWADAARHVFTIGFVTLVIVGMSLRILPVFSGKTLWSAKLAWATYTLILAGVAMRLLQYPAAWHARLYEAGSWMGVLVVAALVLFTVNLVKTMRATTGPPAAAAAGPAKRAFTSNLPVR